MGCCSTKSSPDLCTDVVPKETFTTVVDNPIAANTGNKEAQLPSPATNADDTPRPTLKTPKSPASSSSSSDSDPWAVVD